MLLVFIKHMLFTNDEFTTVSHFSFAVCDHLSNDDFEL